MNTRTAEYEAALRFVAHPRLDFTAERFQRVLRVGFVKRDALLIALEDDGVVKRRPNGRYNGHASRARWLLITEVPRES